MRMFDKDKPVGSSTCRRSLKEWTAPYSVIGIGRVVKGLWEGEAETIKDAVEAAVKAKTDLGGADLVGADLVGCLGLPLGWAEMPAKLMAAEKLIFELKAGLQKLQRKPPAKKAKATNKRRSKS